MLYSSIEIIKLVLCDGRYNGTNPVHHVSKLEASFLSHTICDYWLFFLLLSLLLVYLFVLFNDTFNTFIAMIISSSVITVTKKRKKRL